MAVIDWLTTPVPKRRIILWWIRWRVRIKRRKRRSFIIIIIIGGGRITATSI